MAGMLDDLAQILESQLENYTDLLDLSGEKKQVIINNDVEALQKITELENVLVSRNQKLEKRREAVMDDIALVLNKKKSGLTVSAIADVIKNKEERDKLMSISEKMRTVLNDLRAQNEVNKVLIENSLEYIDFCMNIVHDQVTESKGYHGTDNAGGKGFIDTKQ